MIYPKKSKKFSIYLPGILPLTNDTEFDISGWSSSDVGRFGNSFLTLNKSYEIQTNRLYAIIATASVGISIISSNDIEPTLDERGTCVFIIDRNEVELKKAQILEVNSNTETT